MSAFLWPVLLVIIGGAFLGVTWGRRSSYWRFRLLGGLIVCAVLLIFLAVSKETTRASPGRYEHVSASWCLNRGGSYTYSTGTCLIPR